MQDDNRIFGLVTGIVEENRDPLDLGRVQVSFSWLAGPGAAGRWARLATLAPDLYRGSWATPEVGREVLVAFEHGDVDRPVVIGVLWSREDIQPDDEDGHAIQSLRSRSGHQVVFDDSEDKPSILIVDKTGNNRVFIDSATNSMAIRVAGDLTIEAGGRITISAGADITMETDANLSIKATGSGEIETSGPLDVKSSVKLALDGAGQAELRAATVSVNASGMAELKGGLVKIN